MGCIRSDSEYLKFLFSYNDGVITWRNKSSPQSRIVLGERAGSFDKDGYLIVRVRNQTSSIHRIVWVYHNGEIPAGFEIDHVDGDKLNNRIENLRLTTRSVNCSNQRKRIDNTSGVCGVTFMKDRLKYRAQVRGVRLGQFDTKEEAAEAVAKYRSYSGGFTERHGKEI